MRLKAKSTAFLSTPSARRATIWICRFLHDIQDFYPRPPRGGRLLVLWYNDDVKRFLSTPSARRATIDEINDHIHKLFLSTPSARRATNRRPRLCVHRRYFYPRPPRGGRLLVLWYNDDVKRFLSTPSARRATIDEINDHIHKLFLSTPSARRATNRRPRLCVHRRYFYPRPPRGGRHHQFSAGEWAGNISIHALREEGDELAAGVSRFIFQFLSTPSARRATQGAWNRCERVLISIHALREEGDLRFAVIAKRRKGFLSTPSARRATPDYLLQEMRKIFLSTPSARRATHVVHAPHVHVGNFYPRPPRGGRRRRHTSDRHPRRISIHALREEGDRRPPFC